VAELFDPDTYKLQSAHSNKLAFRLDAAMFRRVLAGLAVSDAARRVPRPPSLDRLL